MCFPVTEKPADSPFSSRFEDARKGFGDSGGAGGGKETKSTRTYTVTEGTSYQCISEMNQWIVFLRIALSSNEGSGESAQMHRLAA